MGEGLVVEKIIENIQKEGNRNRNNSYFLGNFPDIQGLQDFQPDRLFIVPTVSIGGGYDKYIMTNVTPDFLCCEVK